MSSLNAASDNARGGKVSSLLIYRNVVDLDLGICVDGQHAIKVEEEGRMVYTIVIGRVGDSVSAGTRVTSAVVNGTSPITTDGNVDDDCGTIVFSTSG